MPFRSFLFASVVVLVCLPHASLAQERCDIVYAFPVFTVTATRNPENILKVPLVVSEISSASFTHSLLIRPDQALRRVPGVLAQGRSGAQDVRLTRIVAARLRIHFHADACGQVLWSPGLPGERES